MNRKDVFFYGALLLAVVIGLLLTLAGEPPTGTPMQNDRLDSFAAIQLEPMEPTRSMAEPVPIEYISEPRDPALSYILPSGSYNWIAREIDLHASRSTTEDMEFLVYQHKDYHGLWHNFHVLQPPHCVHVPLHIRVNVVDPRITTDTAQFSYTLLPGDTLRLHEPQDTVQLKWIRSAINGVVNADIRSVQ